MSFAILQALSDKCGENMYHDLTMGWFISNSKLASKISQHLPQKDPTFWGSCQFQGGYTISLSSFQIFSGCSITIPTHLRDNSSRKTLKTSLPLSVAGFQSLSIIWVQSQACVYITIFQYFDRKTVGKTVVKLKTFPPTPIHQHKKTHHFPARLIKIKRNTQICIQK